MKTLVVVIGLGLVALVAGAPALGGDEGGCFNRSSRPYLVAAECIDANLIWHSTVRSVPNIEGPVSAVEIGIDPEWVRDDEVDDLPETIVLLGVGAIDEVPLALAIPHGSISWNSVELVESASGILGSRFKIERLNSVDETEDTMYELVVYENHEILLDGAALTRRTP